jgi:hypothetical protein
MTKQRDASIDGDALKTETTIGLIFFTNTICASAQTGKGC